jgi:hypothetical protein
MWMCLLTTKDSPLRWVSPNQQFVVSFLVSFSLSKDRFEVGGPNNTGFRAIVAFGVNGLLSTSIIKVDLPIDSTKPGMCRFSCQRFTFMT